VVDLAAAVAVAAAVAIVALAAAIAPLSRNANRPLHGAVDDQVEPGVVLALVVALGEQGLVDGPAWAVGGPALLVGQAQPQ
jgi:hypothetical protein